MSYFLQREVNKSGSASATTNLRYRFSLSLSLFHFWSSVLTSAACRTMIWWGLSLDTSSSILHRALDIVHSQSDTKAKKGEAPILPCTHFQGSVLCKERPLHCVNWFWLATQQFYLRWNFVICCCVLYCLMLGPPHKAPLSFLPFFLSLFSLNCCRVCLLCVLLACSKIQYKK